MFKKITEYLSRVLGYWYCIYFKFKIGISYALKSQLVEKMQNVCSVDTLLEVSNKKERINDKVIAWSLTLSSSVQ